MLHQCCIKVAFYHANLLLNVLGGANSGWSWFTLGESDDAIETIIAVQPVIHNVFRMESDSERSAYTSWHMLAFRSFLG